jgi:hypothetical protein
MLLKWMQQLRLQKTSLVNHPVVFGFRRMAVGNKPMIPKIQPAMHQGKQKSVGDNGESMQ